MRALLVEHEQTRSDQLNVFLRAEGVHVEITNTGEYALDLVRHYDFDLIMLNLALSDMPGSTLISHMRAARHDTPVLAFSKSLSIKPKLEALAAGADDVVDQAIEPTELLARMRAIVRRNRGHSQPKLQVEAITLDINQQAVRAHGIAVTLTGKEFAILQLLMLRKNMVMSKEAILANLYGGMDEPEIKIIDVFICKLRKKLASAGVADAIGTVWGCGYIVRDRSRDWDTLTDTAVPQRGATYNALAGGGLSQDLVRCS